ncbi:MAG: biotin/lipoyl-containing protein [Desulfurococcaceae archaeon]
MPKLYKVKTIFGTSVELEVIEKTRSVVVLKDVKTGDLYKIAIKKADGGKYVLNINGQDHVVYSSENVLLIDFSQPLVSEVRSELVQGSRKEKSEHVKFMQQVMEPGVLQSPISGKIVDVRVKPGSTVNVGDTVVLLESMKMIIEVKSHIAGVVEEVYVHPGKTVNKGDRLLKIKSS